MTGRRSIHDLAIVGGGMAGLSAAAFASRAGRSVLLLEKEPVLGGLCGSFKRKGFTWDSGIRALEDSGILLPMLESLGIDLDLVRSPVSLGIEDRIIPVESPENLTDYRELLERFYPDHRRDIDRILKVIRKVMKLMKVLYGIENPAFKELPADRDYLFRKLLPWLGKFLFTIGRINRMSEPVEESLARLTTHRPLIDIIGQHFFQGTPAFFALSYFSLYLDYVYPRGGTGALPRGLEEYCRRRGVDIRTETRVTRVYPAERGVADESGTVYGYRKLIWAADLKALYRSLAPDALPAGKIRETVRNRAALLEASRGGDSVFTLYLAVDIDPAWFATKSNGHFFYTPSRKGLGPEIRRDLTALLARAPDIGDKEFRQNAEDWIGRYIERNTFEISIPVLKDPSLAPPGRTGLIVSVLFDYELCEAAYARGWYEDLKVWTEDRMIDALEGSVYPGLRNAVLDRFSYTPRTICRTVGSSEGAITGWAFTNPIIPAIRRMQDISRSVRTGIPDVFQAGQWTYSPSGLPIAVLTGKLAADRATRDLGRRA